MQAKAVIFDYHGTLVDPWKRYLESFSQAMKKCCNSAVTDREFIKEQRRAGTPTHKILESILKKSGFPQPSELAEEINNYRRALVSSPDFFRENPDTLIEGAKETLQKMKKQGAKIFLVSLIPLLDHSEERKIKKLIHNQLVAYELEKEFSEVFIEITPYGKKFGNVKLNAFKKINEKNGFSSNECVVVGDSEIELNAGKTLGMKTVGVLTGMSSRERLEKLKVDRIIGSVAELELF